MFCRTDRFVFEDFADRKKDQPRQSLRVQADAHRHSVVQIIDIAMSDHTEASSLDQQIAGIDHAMIDRKISGSFVCGLVSDTGYDVVE